MILTHITTGRNEDYCGNFRQRITYNITKMCSNIDNLNIQDVEIIVVDWGSDIRLSELIPIKRPYLKYVYVPQNVINRLNTKFSNSHAWNVGARKSSGKFLLHTEADCYIPEYTFNKLYNYLKENINNDLYSWASRWHLPYRIHSNLNSYQDIDKEIKIWNQSNRTIWEEPRPGQGVHSKVNSHVFGGDGTAMLTSRNIFFDTTGIAEAFIKWGQMDIEHHLRIIQKYKYDGDLAEIIDSEFIHLSHHEINTGCIVHGGNPEWRFYFKANDENSWGFNNINEIEFY